jgi:hypothetical protein
MIITTALLQEHNACKDQVALFFDTFGESAVLNPETWTRAHAVGLQLAWLSWVLPVPLLKTYEEAVAPLSKTYNEARAPLLKAYNEAVAPLLKAYDEARAPLLYSLLMQVDNK